MNFISAEKQAPKTVFSFVVLLKNVHVFFGGVILYYISYVKILVLVEIDLFFNCNLVNHY